MKARATGGPNGTQAMENIESGSDHHFHLLNLIIKHIKK